jgi:hypothetical protein
MDELLVPPYAPGERRVTIRPAHIEQAPKLFGICMTPIVDRIQQSPAFTAVHYGMSNGILPGTFETYIFHRGRKTTGKAAPAAPLSSFVLVFAAPQL